MTVYVDDVVAWLQGREWLVLNGYLPRYHAVLCDPPYFLGSITKRFGKPGSAPALPVRRTRVHRGEQNLRGEQ